MIHSSNEVFVNATGLQGAVVLITGGTRGIGHATGLVLAQAGAVVIITGRDGATARMRAAEISDRTGAEVHGLELDVTDFGAAGNIVRMIATEQGRLDVLVANAGIMPTAPIGMITETHVRETLNTNVLGVIAVVQESARVMRRHRRGSIILMSSIVARDGAAGQAVYAASKAAVAAITRSAAKELGRWGIRVNAVAPGVIQTDLLSGMSENTLGEIAARAPLGRLGTAEDVAYAIRFLASSDAAFITGQVLYADGGLVS
jgi:3-oxoacyl-[acyl-carrier protein] reductase